MNYSYSIILANIMALFCVFLLYNVEANSEIDKFCYNVEFQADCSTSIPAKVGNVVNEKEVFYAAVKILEERANAGIDEATEKGPSSQGDIQGMLMAAISDYTNVVEACEKAKGSKNVAEVESALKEAGNSISNVNDIFAIQENPLQGINYNMHMAARTAIQLIPKSLG